MQADATFAERIALLACRRGYEYWLDVHDPILNLLGGQSSPIPAVIQSLLVAAIVEIALLNCTHAIAVQTKGAQASRWVPYEYGRSKRPALTSRQVASWFAPGVFGRMKADYLKLGVCVFTEGQIEAWLGSEHYQQVGNRSRRCAPTSEQWQPRDPPRLPGS